MRLWVSDLALVVVYGGVLTMAARRLRGWEDAMSTRTRLAMALANVGMLASLIVLWAGWTGHDAVYGAARLAWAVCLLAAIYALCSSPQDASPAPAPRSDTAPPARKPDAAPWLFTDAELEDFLYKATHDVRSPLRALKTIPEWVRETLTTTYGEVHKDLEVDLAELEVQSARLEALADDFQAFSRIALLTFEPETIDLGSFVPDIAEEVAVPDTFVLTMAKDLPSIEAPRDVLRCILSNVIDNAVRHHDREDGALDLRAHVDGSNVILTLSDDGPGIPAEYREQVFEPFVALKSRDEVEGTGLGLTIVKAGAARLGGRARVRPDAAGRGTTIEISIPAGPK